MREFQNADLIRLLANDEATVRTLALNFLSEGYAQDAGLLTSVFAGWDRWGVDVAFPEFPILSHVPIPAAVVRECCQRSAAIVPNRKVTDRQTRCAGKLMEQVVRLPAADLQSHQLEIAQTVALSKIFFRIDLTDLENRIAMLELTSDQLAERLDSVIAALGTQPDNRTAYHQALAALESLRFQHPAYIDMASAIARTPPDSGVQAASFQVSIQSLIQFAQAGVEEALAKFLVDTRESVHCNAVEALVRIGSPLAAAHLVARFDQTDAGAQRWVARGLQRMRANGLAVELARLRSATEDPALWGMLLVAEVRQFDLSSLELIAAELERVQGFSGALIDALNVYVRVYETAPGARLIQQAFMNYVKRVSDEIASPNV